MDRFYAKKYRCDAFMELIENILGGALVFMGLVIVGGNYYRQVLNFKNRKNKDRGWSSPMPFVGPLFVIMGYSMLPIDFEAWVIWIVVLDPDTILTIVSLPYLLIAFFRR